MWSGNACIHGMTSVTLPSIAYIATQVCYLLIKIFFWCLLKSLLKVHFALSSSAIFSCRHHNRLRMLLQQYYQNFWRSWRTDWSQWPSNLVEQVTWFYQPVDCPDSLIHTGRYSHSVPQWDNLHQKNSVLTKIKERHTRKRAALATAQTNNAISPPAVG